MSRRAGDLYGRRETLAEMAEQLEAEVDNVLATSTRARAGYIEVIHAEQGAPFSIELWRPDEWDVQLGQVSEPFAGATRWLVWPDSMGAPE